MSALFPPTPPGGTPPTGADVMRRFLPTSAYVRHLGLRLDDIQPGRAELTLPFAERVVTIGNTVHGGAIASLIDTAAMVAAWSGSGAPGGVPLPETLRGTTVGMSVSYLAPANGEDIQAVASVLRQGRSLSYLDVEVRTAAGTLVAKGLVTYKLG